MKTRDCCTAVLLVVLLCTVAFARGGGSGWLPKGGGPSEIAVYVTGDLNEDEKAVLGSRIFNALVNSGRFTAAERASVFTAAIGNVQVTQSNGVVDDAYIGRIAKQFGIRYVCIVGVASFSGNYNVSARMLDAGTAKVTTFGRVYGELNSTQTLEALSRDVVVEMGIGGYQLPPSSAAAAPPPVAASAPSLPPPSAVTAPEPQPVAVAPPPPQPPTTIAPPPPPPLVAVAVASPPSPPPTTVVAPPLQPPPAVTTPPPPPPVATAPSPSPAAVAPLPPATVAPPPAEVDMTPPPPPEPEDVAANIIIHSVPDSADVYIGNRFIGKANQKLWMPSGTHEVKFIKGDLEKTEIMTLKDGENTIKVVHLSEDKPNKKNKSNKK